LHLTFLKPKEQTVIHRAFRYRLYPTAEQAARLEQTAGAVRFVYNLALEQRRDFWRQAKAHGIRLNYVSQGRQITELRRECDWLAEVSYTPLTQALIDLDSAFRNFFAGRARFPSFRQKDFHRSFRQQGDQIRVESKGGRFALIRIPKIGLVKMRLTRPLRGRTLSATFSNDALGWHVSLACEIEHEAKPSALPAIGIDRGIANTLALSNGEMLSTPRTDALERRKRKAQRILARRTRGSNRYRKQRLRLSRITAKIARARVDWQHKVSLSIAQRFGAITVEALAIRNMTASGRGKRALNRSILEQCWRGFEDKLSYKIEERGGSLTRINPAYTSQECSACGVIDKASRESQASFACRHCGFTDHADTNAAKNILRRSTAVAEGCGYAPVEARTRVLAT
jgi:putative transposase